LNFQPSTYPSKPDLVFGVVPSPERRREASRHRRLVSQVLVAGLIAVAYSEPVGPVSDSFNRGGVDIRSLAWLAIYIVTVLRFFVGNIVHLEDEDLTKSEAAFRWFWDLSFIILECIVLIFAGAVTSLDASAKALVSFTDYLVVLYVIDVVWILSSRLMHRIGLWGRLPGFKSMVRGTDLVPLEWAVVNGVLAVVTWRLAVIGHPAGIPNWKLWVLLLVNFAVFFYDLIKIAYGIRDAPSAATPNDPRPATFPEASGGSGGAG
jgi:hypothetical protein